MRVEDNIKKEYERLKLLFNGVDEVQLELLDGALVEAARLKVELDDLRIIVKQTGLIQVSKKDANKQRELPVGKILTKTRANYLNYLSKLSNMLGKNVDEDEDDLSDFE